MYHGQINFLKYFPQKYLYFDFNLFLFYISDFYFTYFLEYFRWFEMLVGEVGAKENVFEVVCMYV
jgi:hypothetical protein